MMTSIIPSDMALSPMGGRRAKIGRSGREQSTYDHPVPAQEPGDANKRGYFGCSLSAAELMQ
jgi:hypothetical protein